MTLGVLFGGPSPEHDVSILTGLQAAQALAGAGRAVTGIYWAKTGDWHAVHAGLEGRDFADGLPRGAQALRLVAGPGGGFVARGGRLGGKERALDLEAVVNCCHGGPGEDGTLQGLLDTIPLAYTGPSARGAALGMDKLAFAAVAAAAGLPSLPRAALDDEVGPDFTGPYIVKPRYGGSSIGIEVAEDLDTARALLRSSPHLQQGAIVEPYRAGAADINVGIRVWPALELSAVERPLRRQGGEFYRYTEKYVGGEGMVSAPRELPAALPDAVGKEIRRAARVVAGVAGVRGVARLDFLLDGDDIFVNEINTIPGSLARYLWIDPVVPFERLLLDLVDEAQRGPSVAWTAAGADGLLLRTAGSIASKLG